MTPDDLSDRLLDFSARIGKVIDSLPDTRLGRHVAGQLVRCGTAPGPNYEEARAAESRDDFAHKISICLKELRETRFWLRFAVRTELLPAPRLTALIGEAEELAKILAQSRLTARKNAGHIPPN